MKYYIDNQNQIVTTSEVALQGDYTLLNENQIEFWEANKPCSVQEVIAGQLNVPTGITLSEAKTRKIAELEEEFRKETQETGVIDTNLGFTVRGRYLDLMNVLTIQKSLELDNNSEQFIFDIDTVPHQLNLADINTIFTAFVIRGKELYIKLQTLINTVNSKLKVSTVEAIKW